MSARRVSFYKWKRKIDLYITRAVFSWRSIMSKLSDPQISAKCVEISKSLLNTQVGLLNYDLCTSRSIGDAARFAASIRRAGEIGQDTLAGFSAALKIDFRIAKSEILPLFEDLNWIEVKRKGNVIERVEEKIPPAEDIRVSLEEHERKHFILFPYHF